MIRISVIICCYNSRQTVISTLESILSQTIFKDIELVIVDDNSTDDTYEVIATWVHAHGHMNENIRLYHKDVNNGIFSCRKYALDKCGGNYIIYIDSDDTIEDTYLEELRDNAQSTLADIIQTSSVVFNYSGNNGGTLKQDNTCYNYIADNIGLHKCEDKMLSCWLTLWNRLFKSCVIKHILEIPDFRLNFLEDMLIYSVCYVNSKTVSNITTKSHYIYNLSLDNSLTKTNSTDEEMLLAFRILEAYIIINNYTDYLDTFNLYKCKYIYNFTKKHLVEISNKISDKNIQQNTKLYNYYVDTVNKLTDTINKLSLIVNSYGISL